MAVEEEDGAAVTGGAAVTSNEPAPSRQCYILWMVEGKEKCRVREQIYVVVLALS